ncbi:hybrid sensor histidine kinase/response regulator [Chryseosolibacter indicus]|uniref:histidine kinase n=1 Tax=Chryseosolibacter indicus TaxID=2782351 RepID=A0ABS5VTN6_9BACT|nr:response regulator [Chryseosolibacter indicus]MBT1704778.1 response regulator [Chryseosolibacter indicus]
MVLIVDDNQENIFSLKTLLTLHQFEVDTASSGEEALKKILQNSYSLIILDVQMPEMDGFEVAEAISGYSRSKDIPIIFLSAVNTHKKFITKGYESGGIDYVTKPFDPDILLLKVKTFYRLSEQRRELTAMEKNLRQEIELRKKAEEVLEQKVEERTEELKRSNQRLEESNKELQQFAFIASHDLQEPLRKIQTFSNLALDRHINERDKVKSYLQKITGSAGRLRSLITDLLEYSKIYVEDRFEPTDLEKLVEDVLSDLELSIKDKSCSIEIARLPVIEAIPSQIRQVFQNLLSNALKFSKIDEPCEISITGEIIESRLLDSPPSTKGKFCRIKVKDNGIGFNSEFSERIFEIFQRLNPKSVYEGTGIGLAIVKKVIERHDGLITVSSKENEGTVFTIVLPIKKVFDSSEKI